MNTSRPRFDIQLGDTRFSDAGLLSLVKSVQQSRNNDKTVTRGKKRIKINRCDIELVNQDSQLNNILRMGRSFKVWMGYEDYPLTMVGSYRMEHPKWMFQKSGPPTITLRGVAGDVKLAYDKRAKSFVNKTHSQIAEKLAAEHGLKAKVRATPESVHLVKSAYESDYDFLDRLAFDVGYDWWVDETTEPHTLVFEPPKEENITAIGGTPLTLGWGDGSPASLLAETLTVDIKFPETKAASSGRKQDGTAVKVWSSQQGDWMEVQVDAGEIAALHKGTTPEGGPASRQKVASVAHYATTKKTMDATLMPGIPFLKLNQIMPLVGLGDISGRYRIVEIVNHITPNKYETRIKGVIGGGGGGNKKKRDLDDYKVKVWDAQTKSWRTLSVEREAK